jgi:ABC-type taurine transport system ATPase subunit
LIDLDGSGWPVQLTDRLIEEIDDPKNKKLPIEERLTFGADKAIVSVLGLFNKGKTFLLNQICNINLPSGLKVNTKGLSFQEPNNNKNIVLLDTAGASAPLQGMTNISYFFFILIILPWLCS